MIWMPRLWIIPLSGVWLAIASVSDFIERGSNFEFRLGVRPGIQSILLISEQN